MPVVWPYANGGVVWKVTKTTAATAVGTNATSSTAPSAGGTQSKPPPIAGIPGLPPASP
jgi:hypothetical protein